MRRKSLFALLTSLTAISALFMALAGAAHATPGTDVTACVFNGSTGANDLSGNPTASLDDIQDPGQDATDNSGGDYPMPAPIPDLPTAGLPLLDTENGGPDNDVDGDPGGSDYGFGTSPNPIPGVATQCLHLDLDGTAGVGDGSNDTGVYLAEIEASGSYNNIVCGTGNTNGTATLEVQDGDAANTNVNGDDIDHEVNTVTSRYFIQFVLGQGALVFTGETNGAEANSGGDHASLLGTGVVDIRPRPSVVHPPPATTDEGCVNVDVSDFDVTGILVGANTDGAAGQGEAAQVAIEAFLNGFKQ